MTANQIAFGRYLEDRRSNQESERLKSKDIEENIRTHQENEAIQRKANEEIARANAASEKLRGKEIAIAAKNAHTNRMNARTNEGTLATKQAEVDISQQNADTNAQNAATNATGLWTGIAAAALGGAATAAIKSAVSKVVAKGAADATGAATAALVSEAYKRGMAEAGGAAAKAVTPASSQMATLIGSMAAGVKTFGIPLAAVGLAVGVNAKAAVDYMEWFDSLTPEQQEAERRHQTEIWRKQMERRAPKPKKPWKRPSGEENVANKFKHH